MTHDRLIRWLAPLHPAPEKRKLVLHRVLLGAAMFVPLYIVGHFMPLGFDWVDSFSKGIFPAFWMPWTKLVVGWMNWPTVFALTCVGLALRILALQNRPSPLALALAFISLPTLWVFFLGNYDGLVVLGLLLMPLGVPLALLKPHLTAFAMLANRRWFIAAAIWGILSLVFWGLWPLNLSEVFAPDWKEEWVQDITLFPWGLIIALPLMWFSRGDEDMLMAAGSLCTPHLFAYQYIVLMPALARLSAPWMWITWLSTWTPLLANWLGPWAWHFGNSTAVFFWVGLYLSRRGQQTKLAQRVELTESGNPPAMPMP